MRHLSNRYSEVILIGVNYQLNCARFVKLLDDSGLRASFFDDLLPSENGSSRHRDIVAMEDMLSFADNIKAIVLDRNLARCKLPTQKQRLLFYRF